jgi:hypothetical protein
MSAYWSGDRRRLMASALPALGEKFVLAMRAGDQLRPDPRRAEVIRLKPAPTTNA